MSAQLVRLVARLASALAALVVLYATASLVWFGVACVGGLVTGALADHAYRRLASPDDIRGDLDDRVRNPPS